MAENSHYNSLGLLLRLTYQQWTLAVDTKLAEEGFGDLRPHYANVFTFVPPEGIQVAELTKLAHVRKQSMTQTIEELEKLGYVERRPDPNDRRARLVFLTERGKKISPIARAAGRAVALVQQALSEVETDAHPVLYSACLIFVADTHLRVGDLETADHVIRRMIAHTEKYLLLPHLAIARCLEGRLLLARGELDAGIALLQEGFAVLEAGEFRIAWRLAAPELAEALYDSGQPVAALSVIELVLGQSPPHMLHSPELIRIKGRLLASEPYKDLVGAEDCLQNALAAAASQAMLSWELRVALTLAELWRAQDRAADGAALVDSVQRKFTEGFGTPDFLRAKQFLAEFGNEAMD